MMRNTTLFPYFHSHLTGGLLAVLLSSFAIASPISLPFSFKKELGIISTETNKEAPQNLLFLFMEKKANPDYSQRLKKILSPGSETRTKLEKNYRLCLIELDKEETLKELKDSWILAQELGIPGTPAIYITDMEGRPFARFLGGIKTSMTDDDWVEHILRLKENRGKRDDLLKEAKALKGKERGEKLLKAFALVPRESLPTAYPEEIELLKQDLPQSPEAVRLLSIAETVFHDKKKKELIARWGNPAVASLKGAPVTLTQVDEYLKKEKPSGETRQFILLEYRFPLLVAKARQACEKKGKGVFSLESDQALREAMDDLGTVISANPDNRYGREAQRLKGLINQERRKMR